MQIKFKTKETKVTFDKERYLRDFTETAKKVLDKIGKRLARDMGHRLRDLDGFPTDWRLEMIGKLQNRVVEEAEGFIRQGVGLIGIEDDEFALIRAKILEHGTGFRGEDGSGYAIWHWQGVRALNSEVTSRHVSDKESFPLPDEFNMYPGHWFKDSCTLIDEIFDDEVERALKKINPFKYIKIK